jgi:hypothetical protein
MRILILYENDNNKSKPLNKNTRLRLKHNTLHLFLLRSILPICLLHSSPLSVPFPGSLHAQFSHIRRRNHLITYDSVVPYSLSYLLPFNSSPSPLFVCAANQQFISNFIFQNNLCFGFEAFILIFLLISICMGLLLDWFCKLGFPFVF